MTYPQVAVRRELQDRFVCVKLESALDPSLARSLGIRWMPGLAVLGADGRAACVQTGFLPPADLLLELTFGRAILAMGQKRYAEAHALFREVMDAEGAERAPEAAFFLGVSRYRETKAFGEAVLEPWGAILARWPRSQWARKVGWALGKATPAA